MAEAAQDLKEEPARANSTAETRRPCRPQRRPRHPLLHPPSPPRLGQAAEGSYIIVRDRYTLYCDRLIPSLEMPNAQAFEVTDRQAF